MGIFGDEDVKQILKMIEPEVFTEEEEDVEEEEEGEEEEEDEEEKEEDEEEEAREKEDEEKPRTPDFNSIINVFFYSHTLSWGSQFSFCGIELLTEDGTMVFSQPLSGMESSVTIPESLSGTFTIVMYLGDMVYTGEITM